MKSALAIGFILVVAGIAIWVASLDTVVSGKVIEQRMMAALGDKGISQVTCDPAIPLGRGPTIFRCIAADPTGATARLEMKLQEDGGFEWKALEVTPGEAPAE